MKKTNWLVFVYALFVLAGGIVGHLRAGSRASLISGLSFGVVLLLASFLIYRKKNSGYWLALFSTIILDGFFIWRFSKSLQFFPSGFLSLLSLFVVIVVALKIRTGLKLSR